MEQKNALAHPDAAIMKENIARNWLPRYTKRKKEDFTD